MSTEKDDLSKEWQTLQNQFDSYEKYSLLIKLFNIFITLTLLVAYGSSLLALAACCIIWLQDGIWKTFQFRIGDRLERVEQSIATGNKIEPMQFNSEWEEQRPSAVGLIIQYIKNTLKPTVAYPHVILLIVGIVFTVLFSV